MYYPDPPSEPVFYSGGVYSDELSSVFLITVEMSERDKWVRKSQHLLSMHKSLLWFMIIKMTNLNQYTILLEIYSTVYIPTPIQYICVCVYIYINQLFLERHDTYTLKITLVSKRNKVCYWPLKWCLLQEFHSPSVPPGSPLCWVALEGSTKCRFFHRV